MALKVPPTGMPSDVSIKIGPNLHPSLTKGALEGSLLLMNAPRMAKKSAGTVTRIVAQEAVEELRVRSGQVEKQLFPRLEALLAPGAFELAGKKRRDDERLHFVLDSLGRVVIRMPN